ncbi:MAG: hypothetical protein E6J90_18155 [Deltaproteobacteria bacterium]|nr:MAG: hypothetical protein E6J91_37840 [Deltaproteobacteria bacterium]TMQ19398.1 MAG: hypothetical protein E6J90_18155 [Deltaproteobacteria bacterium]
MTERSDLANLRALGAPRVHDWAGAAEPIGAGLVEWARRAVGHDQALAVRASLEACALVLAGYPEAPAGLAPRAYIDHMIAVIRRWLERPTREHCEAVRSSLDVTRARHAWQTDEDDPQFWILEAVDHTCLTVWAGERASYIIPLDFATSAGRVIACVFHAMRSAGLGEQGAAGAVIDVVLRVTA